MGFIKFIVWTSLSIGIGVYISTARYPNGTPLEQVERFFHRHLPPEKVESIEADVRTAIDSAARRTVARREPPTERHTAPEREAVTRLISSKRDAR